jgi:iron complex outermembrane receptor protein
MNQKQFSQELQLTGTALEKKLKYVLGAYYFTESGDLHDYVTFAEGLLQVDGPNNLSTKNYAFYGQVDYALSDLLAFTVGGRYTHESKEFEGFQSDANGLNYKLANYFGDPNCASLNPISDACRIDNGFPNAGQPLRYYVAGVQHKTFSNFSPKVGVQLHPNQDVMVYASWSKGYKTGGWTTRLSNPLPYAPASARKRPRPGKRGSSRNCSIAISRSTARCSSPITRASSSTSSRVSRPPSRTPAMRGSRALKWKWWPPRCAA